MPRLCYPKLVAKPSRWILLKSKRRVSPVGYRFAGLVSLATHMPFLPNWETAEAYVLPHVHVPGSGDSTLLSDIRLTRAISLSSLYNFCSLPLFALTLALPFSLKPPSKPNFPSSNQSTWCPKSSQSTSSAWA